MTEEESNLDHMDKKIADFFQAFSAQNNHQNSIKIL